jgi:3-dehydroquinate dehydratase
MTTRLMILNGPNLNLLGIREPDIYGSTTLHVLKTCCEEFARFAGIKLAFHQSNHEGVLVDHIQAAPAGRRRHHHQSGRILIHIDSHAGRPQDLPRPGL